mmetsp:Transcript_7575/g.14166  ORF Transcript_7575/g.14166 Transcript_7575/m.14166 type:complete len:274 (-) Transcript_7575:6389-7210(-)|eukprot:CAMPEP_0204901490 /NCGR_PEP_ID=MMETSP1397-20131031/3108_1 /ASSEMBLY_ACC=CAM_ASM_000891 /TAXON_ID=49980 /ORGANISM="Climacostomum Climacostomum virens, Strain Stock W-24" /LENGTH=273 /DNA_ID=CAMNT_0052069855 /DNA_START=94 /DNA_END=915 /DNA_ORIENTATION=+
MSEDLSPVLKVCGKRTYRHYPIVSLPVLVPQFSQENIEKIGDDADELEAIAVNLDSAPFDELENPEVEVPKSHTVETTKVLYEPRTHNYTSTIKTTNREQFMKLFGRPEQKRPLEDAHDCNLDINKKKLEVKIRGNCPEAVVKLHFNLAGKLTENPAKKYSVVNSQDQSLIAELNAEESTGELVVTPDRNGFTAKIPHFPKECVNFLLTDRASRIRQLKSSLGGNVDFFVNKKLNQLEIWGKTEDLVRSAFQAFFAKLAEDPRAKASFQGLTF